MDLKDRRNAGCEFFAGLARGEGCLVVSAGGKSNIFKKLMNTVEKQVLVIADGAAFGPEMIVL